jgi:hypothetical protein
MCREIGFLSVAGHGVPDDVINTLYCGLQGILSATRCTQTDGSSAELGYRARLYRLCEACAGSNARRKDAA